MFGTVSEYAFVEVYSSSFNRSIILFSIQILPKPFF